MTEENDTTNTTATIDSEFKGKLVFRGNTYYARYMDAKGIRREVSTHTSNRKEALRIFARL